VVIGAQVGIDRDSPYDLHTFFIPIASILLYC
jgi:hypothetical protein